MKTLLLLLVCVGLLACDKKGSVDSTKARARAEEEANGDVQKQRLVEKVRKMEDDLSVRHHFYTAMSGKYKGVLYTGDEELKIKITLAPSIPPYLGNRVRELSEVEFDLNNLFFNVQIVQWHSDSNDSAVGCRVSELRPNMQTGQLIIASPECPNLYIINIGDDLSGNRPNVYEARAAVLADELFNLRLDNIERLLGMIQPSTIAKTYYFNVVKQEP